ncbi:MAG: MATE family efflux transporter [Lachnospiraceae bacterium]|nr:MATE family efflux transporter [Lachnospiraceae bacterium]
MNYLKRKYIGDRDFYASVMTLVIPMILQNVITNFVSMLDNIMVGQLGTEQMNGVSIVNQFVFIFNITVFGAISGPGIFGAQFYGKGDHEGQRETVRFRLMLAAIIIVVFSIAYTIWQEPLISLYIAKDDAPELIEATMKYGKEYMSIMIISCIPFAIGQAYSSVVRECGETKIPMYGSMAAVFINLVLDYGLIFGKLGMPKLGVAGAAIATVVAKFIEAGVVIFWAHTHHERNKYIVGLFKSLYIKKELLINMIKKGTPLLFNEFLWVIGMSVVAQCYSIRGLDVVAARNISSVITNLFGIVYIQIGGATAIILGNKLGAGKLDEAKEMAPKLRVFGIMLALAMGICMIPFAYMFPNLYNTTATVRSLAAYLIIVSAIAMPLWSYTNTCYFTLRSGGRTGITFLFDFVFTWIVMIPMAIVFCYFTKMDFMLLFAIITYTEVVKCIIGYFMVRSELWVVNMVAETTKN